MYQFYRRLRVGLAASWLARGEYALAAETARQVADGPLHQEAQRILARAESEL